MPGEIMAVTAHIREDRFYAIDSDGRTWITEFDGGTEMVEGAPLPDGVIPQWRGLWRDGDIPGLLYIAGGEGGIWKSVDGFATPEGYFQMRAPGVDGSPSNAVHRRVGLHGKLQEAPQPIPEGRVYMLGSNEIAVRVASGQWELLTNPGIGTNLRQIISATGDPDRLYVRNSNGVIARSTDAGASWTVLSHGMSNVNWISPGASEFELYVGSRDGIARSTDGGEEFMNVWSNVVEGQMVRIVGDRAWFGARTSVPTRFVHYTDDDFATIDTAEFSGAVGGAGGLFAISFDSPNTVYHWRGTFGTTFQRWRIGEENVTNISPPSLDDESVRWAEAHGDGTVLALIGARNAEGFVVRSTNQGDDWTTVIPKQESLQIDSAGLYPVIASDPNDSTEWWVAGGQSGGTHVFHSVDDGISWDIEVCEPHLGNIIYSIWVSG